MGRTKSPFLATLLLILPLPALTAVFSPASAAIAVNLSVGIAPPPLLVYAQPPIPRPGYLWMPGYWAWNGTAYYWVPGVWVLPPRAGLLWTPPWWGWVDGVYVWHAGYWGPHVGFYGGIDYGFGYSGHGYNGGFWDHGRFFYNRSVNNIRNVHITNIYNRAVVSDRTVNRISFNGGRDGVNVRPTRDEQAAAREPHVQPTVFQKRHMNTARSNRNLLASSNRGQPGVVKTNLSGQRPNAGNFARTAEGRRDSNPARMNVARPAPRASAVNAGERRETPQRGGEQRAERGRRE
jgi:hypothetical protein